MSGTEIVRVPASTELPDVDGLPDLGNPAHVVWLWLSRFIGNQRGRRRAVYPALSIIRHFADVQFVRDDRSVSTALAAEALPTVRAGKLTLRALGLEPNDLDSRWRIVQPLGGPLSTLPPDLLVSFVKAEYWPVLAEMIARGPEEVWDRFGRALYIIADRPVRQDRRRGANDDRRRTAGGLETYQVGFRVLMRELHQLALSVPAEHLAQWRAPMPERLSTASISRSSFQADRSAPALLEARRALRRLDQRAKEKLRTAAGRRWARLALRDRALCGLIASMGCRIGAVARLRAGDYRAQHHFPATGERGPAIRIEPEKGQRAAWKALHPEVAGWVEDWLEWSGNADRPEQPMWPSLPANRGGAPPDKGITSDSIYSRFVGRRKRDTAFIPLSTSSCGADGLGYSPHTLRHLAEQYIIEAASDYLNEHPEERAFISPQVIANAALDHKQPTDALGYKDLERPENKERLARIGLLGYGEYLLGDRGARKGPDQLRIETSERALAEARARVDDLSARAAELRQTRAGLLGENPGAAVQAMEREAMIELSLRLQQISVVIDDVSEQLSGAHVALADARLDLERARSEQIAIDDFADMVTQAPASESDTQPEEAPAAVRDRVSLAEAAKCFGVSPATMRRWAKGLMPHPDDDPRNPWDAGKEGAPPDCVLVLGQRSKWIIVDRLDPSRISPGVMVRLREALLRSSP